VRGAVVMAAAHEKPDTRGGSSDGQRGLRMVVREPEPRTSCPPGSDGYFVETAPTMSRPEGPCQAILDSRPVPQSHSAAMVGRHPSNSYAALTVGAANGAVTRQELLARDLEPLYIGEIAAPREMELSCSWSAAGSSPCRLRGTARPQRRAARAITARG
jgi:hypothetical protein